jgi:hypothetical protein
MVSSLAIQGDDLLVGGGFTTAGGVSAPYIARWNGSSWSAVGSGFSGGSDHYGVYSLLVRGDQIIASGNFTTAGMQSANRVAIWNGAQWQGLAGGIGKKIVYAAALLNGDLYVGGDFSQAGTKPSDNFARWRQTALPVLLSELSARHEGAAARLSWRLADTAGEFRFHVWRQGPESPRLRLTAGPLAGGDQDYLDLNAPSGAADYWLQDATAAGTGRPIWRPRLSLRASPSPPSPPTPSTPGRRSVSRCLRLDACRWRSTISAAAGCARWWTARCRPASGPSSGMA